MILDAHVSARRALTKRPFFKPPNGERWPITSQWTTDDWRAWLRQSGWDDAAITQYLDVDRYRYGYGLLPDGTIATAERSAAATWLYLPTPKGVSLHKTRELGPANTMWGGAVGGTKSYSALWEAFICCELIEDFRAIIMRRELEELRRTHIDRAEVFADRIVLQRGESKSNASVRVTKQPNQVVFENTGSKILFGHCNALGDEQKYLSEEYDLFIADQAEAFYPPQIVGVAGRLRRTKPHVEPRAIYLPNPGGPAHHWLEQHHITKDVPDDPLYDPNDYAYITARLYDNPYLMDRDGTYSTYEKRLSAHKPKRRAQLLDGDWSAVVGQFFEDYDAAESVRRVTLPERCKVEVWFRSGEGGKVPYACWVVCLPDGRLHVLAELLMPNQTIGSCATTVNELTREKILPAIRGRWSRGIGSADLFPTKTDVGEPPSETCRKAGLYLLRGDQQEVFGWQRLKHWFARHPIADTPWLTIDPDCAFLRRTLPTLVQDPDAPDLLDPSGDTQAAHALRIGVMARPSPSILNKPDVEKPKGAGEIHSLVQRELHPNVYRGGMVR